MDKLSFHPIPVGVDLMRLIKTFLLTSTALAACQVIAQTANSETPLAAKDTAVIEEVIVDALPPGDGPALGPAVPQAE